MKRRAFLGFLGGAAAAGPRAAAKLSTDLASAAGSIPVPPMGGSYANPVSDGDGWRVTRIAELRKLIAGNRSDEDQRQLKINRLHQVEMEERFRLDSLRSLSATTKARMFIASNVERNDRINRLYAENELERMLKFI